MRDALSKFIRPHNLVLLCAAATYVFAVVFRPADVVSHAGITLVGVFAAYAGKGIIEEWKGRP